MPLIPNFVERTLLLRMNQAPGVILDIFSAAGFRMAHTAIKIGMFDALSEKPMTADEIAQHRNIDSRGAQILLNCLESFGYLNLEGDRYANTKLTSKWLLQDSPSRMLDFVGWWRELVFKFWDEHFDRALREGKPPETIYEWLDHQPGGWAIAQAAFEATARLLVEDVIKKIELPPGATKILDVGGGHGLYSIELCKRYPHLSATIFDLPTALDRARSNIAHEGLAGRVAVKPGDYTNDDLGNDYDGVFLFNVIHAHTADENGHLLDRVSKALNPSGRVMILDQMEDQSIMPVAKSGIRLLAMVYFMTLSGETFAYDVVKGWLKQAGYSSVKRHSFLTAPGNIMMNATKSPN